MTTKRWSQNGDGSGNYHYARGLSGGAIAGVAIGVVVVAVAITGFFWLRRRRNRQRQRQYLGSAANSHPGDLPVMHDTRNIRDVHEIPRATVQGHEGNLDEYLGARKAERDTTASTASTIVPEAQIDTTDHKDQAYTPVSPASPASANELASQERYEVDGAPPAYELQGPQVNRGPHYPSTCISMSRANTRSGNP